MEASTQLVGVSEIADLAGTSRQAVTNWRDRFADFPKPIVELKSGPVWSLSDIKNWARLQGIELTLPDILEQSSPRKRKAVCVAIVNMKGGVGKSTITANLGWWSARVKNLKVLLVDLDPQFNLSQYVLGQQKYEEQIINQSRPTVVDMFEQAVPSGLLPNARRTLSPKDFLMNVKAWSDGSKIDLIPSRLELSWTLKNTHGKLEMLARQLSKLRSEYDLILIDCPPTESMLTEAAYLASEYILVPVKPEFLCTIGLPLLVRSLEDFKQRHEAQPIKMAGVVFNNVLENKEEHQRSKSDVKKVASENGWYVFDHEITYSDSYPKGSRVGKPIFLTAYARGWKVDELRQVAQEFLGRVAIN